MHLFITTRVHHTNNGMRIYWVVYIDDVSFQRYTVHICDKLVDT